MVQFVRRKDGAFHQSEIVVNVRSFRFNGDVWMTYWIVTVFVDPGVQGREIHVMEFYVATDSVMELDGIGSSPEDVVSGF